MSHELIMWIVFWVVVLGMLALDLGIFNRRSHVIGFREAMRWSVFWIALALAFCVAIYFELGAKASLEFLTAYLVEKSLSVDNLFVFMVIFSYFHVSRQFQHKVLFWGILSALVIRAVFIGAGVVLISQFHWIIYLFGAFLIYTGVKMWRHSDQKLDPTKNPIIRLVRRMVPVTKAYWGSRFVIRRMGKLVVTPLFVVLMVIETTDVVFAVDSIPAVLAISVDPFIVYTSNVFAILGLRALYFALAGVMEKFHRLHYGLSLILVFVGGKMLLADFYKLHPAVALGVIALILTASILASVLFPARKHGLPPPADDH